MKLSAIVAILWIAAIQQGTPQLPRAAPDRRAPVTEQDKTPKAVQNNPKAAPPSPASAVRKAPSDNPQGNTWNFDDNIDIQRKLTKYTLALVIAAFVTSFIIGWQSWETRKAANSAKRNTDFLVAIERPWLLAVPVRPMEQKSYPSPDGGGQNVVTMVCMFKNFGKTPAWVTSWTFRRINLEAGKQLPSEPNYGSEVFSIPRTVPPGDDIRGELSWLPEQLNQADADKLFLYVIGFVHYQDGFGNPRETRFCFRYYPPFRENRAQGWHVGGPPEYNKQT